MNDWSMYYPQCGYGTKLSCLDSAMDGNNEIAKL